MYCSSDRERKPMAYKLEGSLLEVCDCEILCPCWVGEMPDNGTCQTALAYHFDRGTIDSVDVSGLTLATNVFVPGTPLAGNWRAQIFIDDRATAEQEAALLSVFTGKQGGPSPTIRRQRCQRGSSRRAHDKFRRRIPCTDPQTGISTRGELSIVGGRCN